MNSARFYYALLYEKMRARIGRAFCFFKKLFLGLGLCVLEHKVNDDAEDECYCDGGNSDLANVDNEAADAADENGRNNEEVLILAEVNATYHLEAGHCDKAVERDAHAAHYAGGNGINECNEGRKEGDENSSNRCEDDGDDGCVPCDSNAGNGLTVGGVGASAEECAAHRAYAVAEKGSREAGIGKKVALDDRGDVLMVGDVLCEYYECNGNVCNRDSAEILGSELIEAAERGKEGELGNCKEGREADAILPKICEVAEIDELKRGVLGSNAYNGEDKGCGVACKDTENEGDELCHLLTVCRAKDNGKEGYKTAKNSDKRICKRNEVCGFAYNDAVLHNLLKYRFGDVTLLKIADSVACKRKTDDSDRRADNYGRHKLVDPIGADELNDKCDDHVNETCENRTCDKAEVSDRGACRACKCRRHRGQECKGGAEEYRASELGKEEIDKGTYACTEECRRRRHAVADDDRNNESRSHNCKKLLNSEDDGLGDARSVADLIDHFHFETSFLFFNFLPRVHFTTKLKLCKPIFYKLRIFVVLNKI